MMKSALSCRIHRDYLDNSDEVIDIDIFDNEDKMENSDNIKELVHECLESLYRRSSINKLQFYLILMTLCTFYFDSHNYIDELLTFFAQDVLPR